MKMLQYSRQIAACAFCLLAATSTGCITFSKHAIPAARLPQQFEAPSRSALTPINFSMLQGSFPKQHLVGPGDVLAVTVQGVIPPEPKELPPLITGQATLNREYYPPTGVVNAPSYGLPLQVQENGVVQLPLVPSVALEGLTLSEAAEKIRSSYIDEGIAREGNDQVNVTLLRSRVNRVLVLREDASIEAANFVRKGEVTLHKRGSAAVVDLPAYESDVLHALATTGGLPGVDAYNEIWILRKSLIGEQGLAQMHAGVHDHQMSPSEVVLANPSHVDAIRVPLKLCPGEPVPFAPDDVVLQDGDVIYVEPRRDDYFYTGGLLAGGQIPMPRDEDLDIIEAIALANGSVGGFGGTSSVAVLRAGAGVGNIIPPTRALVVRKLPNGQQVSIRVDLSQAIKEPSERVRIMAGDYVMLYYKPSEIFANSALNFFNFNWIISD
ncbi:MAG TPA: sugar ABC transporter substrate-binding protein [Planctomycetaceae bacterium]|nr:sugar ABC transporter substrate-binding protein [Planctomycetaceae bacterium]